VLQIKQAWTDDATGLDNMITELVSSGNLETFIRGAEGSKGNRFKLKAIKRWCRELLEGLAYLHGMKPEPVIHRDIKCANILYSSRSGIKIGDFGMCRIGETHGNADSGADPTDSNQFGTSPKKDSPTGASGSAKDTCSPDDFKQLSMDEDGDEGSMMVGTPNFLAPETYD